MLAGQNQCMLRIVILMCPLLLVFIQSDHESEGDDDGDGAEADAASDDGGSDASEDDETGLVALHPMCTRVVVC